MDFEWDPNKAVENLRKHGIDFPAVTRVFDDPLAITTRDDRLTEERFVTIGVDTLGRRVVVVYTWREDRIRIISARRPTSRERRIYEEGR